MKRFVVAISKALLPESIKSLLRRWLMDSSIAQPPPKLPFRLSLVDGTYQASFDKYHSIQTTAASHYDFKHLFCADWQEFDLFLKAAEHAKCFFDIDASRGFSLLFLQISILQM